MIEKPALQGMVFCLLAFVGFLVMLGAAMMFERNARRLGRAGLNSLGRRDPLAG